MAIAVLGLGVVMVGRADIRTVAITGDTAPGTPLFFSEFDRPVINASGKVCFTAYLSSDPNSFGLGVDPNDAIPESGLWSDASGSLSLVALNNEIVPGTATLHYEDFGFLTHLFLNDNGQVGFSKGLEFTTQQNFGVFVEASAGGTLQKIAISGDTATGATAGDRVFGNLTLGRLSDSGDVAFHAFMPPAMAPNNFSSSGIWSDVTGSTDKIAELGDAAPGTAAVFDSFAFPDCNNNGVVAFRGDTGPGGSTHQGIWAYSGGSDTVTDVAIDGDAAPGGGTFSIFFGPSVAVNDINDIAFSATLIGTNEGVWVQRNSTIERVALETEVAPGAGGATFTEIEEFAIAIDGAGHAAFTAVLSDGRRGLFVENSGGLQAVAIGRFNSGTPGDVAPDTGGATFDSIVSWAINDNGHAAFLADLSDFTTAIFAQDATGTLHRIVGDGDELEVAPGNMQTVIGPGLFGNDTAPSASSGFNNNGDVAFYCFFDKGGAGVFVAEASSSFADGDFDMDGDVDLSDFSQFSLCFGGPNNPPAPSCPPGIDADFDDDGDVDLGDFATFSLNFTGPL